LFFSKPPEGKKGGRKKVVRGGRYWEKESSPNIPFWAGRGKKRRGKKRERQGKKSYWPNSSIPLSVLERRKKRRGGGQKKLERGEKGKTTVFYPFNERGRSKEPCRVFVF